VETRIPASERTSQKLNELLKAGVADGDARAEPLKLAVRKIIEEALEAEVGDALGRGYYENGAEPGRGYRNGYRRARLRSAEGPIEYSVPQVTDRTEPFVSRVGRAWRAGRPSSSNWRSRCTRGGSARGTSRPRFATRPARVCLVALP
jgi:Transposase, Mutator family